MKHILVRTLAAASAALLTAAAFPVSAVEQPMAFRMELERDYVLASELADGDVLLKGKVYIDNYTGISELKVTLQSDEPLVIENGGIYRDAPFFEKGSQERYTGVNDFGELKNIAIWYGPFDERYSPVAGKVINPDSPFLQFDLRIPKTTKTGSYEAGFALEDEPSEYEGGAAYPRTFVYLIDDELTVDYLAASLTVEPTYLSGDPDNDGKVTLKDALSALQYYSKKELMGVTDEAALRACFVSPYLHSAVEASDLDGNGTVGLTDALDILRIYTDSLYQ